MYSKKDQKSTGMQTKAFSYPADTTKKGMSPKKLIKEVGKAEASGGDLADLLNKTIPAERRKAQSDYSKKGKPNK